MNDKINEDKAMALFCEASDAEDAGHIELAVKLYRQSATMGEYISQTNLANILDEREDADSKREAMYWYRKAVSKGHNLAAWNLYIHYKMKKHYRWERYWLNKAAEMGHEKAIKTLKTLRKK